MSAPQSPGSWPARRAPEAVLERPAWAPRALLPEYGIAHSLIPDVLPLTHDWSGDGDQGAPLDVAVEQVDEIALDEQGRVAVTRGPVLFHVGQAALSPEQARVLRDALDGLLARVGGAR